MTLLILEVLLCIAAVILPTVWLYLRDRFDATPTMLGLVMTAFYASGLVSAPIMGWWV